MARKSACADPAPPRTRRQRPNPAASAAPETGTVVSSTMAATTNETSTMASNVGGALSGHALHGKCTGAVLHGAECTPRTVSGKLPTAAALQRKREYMDWLAAQDRAAQRDDKHDDSWEAFLAERERKRLQQRSV